MCVCVCVCAQVQGIKTWYHIIDIDDDSVVMTMMGEVIMVMMKKSRDLF